MKEGESERVGQVKRKRTKKEWVIKSWQNR